LGRRPTARDLDERRGSVPSKGVYTKTFGSLRAALAEAGFDAPSKEERLARTVAHGAEFLRRTGRLPSFRDWERLRGGRDDILTAWQVYRLFEETGGAWSAFQYAVTEHARQAEQAPAA
jgi:Homing endonuclease associated repeat